MGKDVFYIPMVFVVRLLGFNSALKTILLSLVVALTLSCYWQNSIALLICALLGIYCISALMYLTSQDVRNLNLLLKRNNSTTDEQASAFEGKFIGPLSESYVLFTQLSHLQKRSEEHHADTNAEIYFSSSELKTNATLVAKNAIEQSETTNSIASAVTELSHSIEDVSNNIAQAQTVVDKTHSTVNYGDEAVKLARTQIDKVASLSQSANNQLIELHQLSSDVSSISTAMASIAEQTNLLALNAAIEAARAGQHGKGFAVVADEVRGLANRSQKSALEISSKIDGLQQKMQQLRQQMDEVVTCVVVTVDETICAQNSLFDIKQQINIMTECMLDITIMSKEQTIVTLDMSENIEKVAVAASLNSEMANESAQIAKHVHQLCEPKKLSEVS